MTHQKIIHKPQLQYTAQFRTRDEQQQLEQLEQQMMSDMKLSAQILKALNSLEALVIFQRVADSGTLQISTTTNHT